MTKKTPTPEQNFFEFIQATASQVNVPWLKDAQPGNRINDWAAGFRRAVKEVIAWGKPRSKKLAPYAIALVHDGQHYGSILAHTVVSRNARRGYKLMIVLVIAGGAVAASMLASATYALYASDLANPSVLMSHKNVGTTILDRNGQALYQVYGANNRKLITLDQVPQSVIAATLAAEDPDFYKHAGVSWKATARALYQDVLHRGKVQGGSTITQQLVKNALLTPGKSFTRKYQEIVLSTELERRYSKDQILQMYLNEIYYGQGSYGIESASQTYFHKPAKDLTVSESAMLAGMPLCPGTCDPNIDPSVAKGRRDFILDRMGDLGSVTAEQLTAAKGEPIQASAQQIEIHAPHFVFYVLDQLRQQYGDDLVQRGGITVYTTLDLAKQQTAENIVRQQIARLAGHHATNSGLVSLDPTNGEILTMVGSVDYNQPDFGNVNVTLANLQPGSSIKPIVYTEAFKKGWNGATTVDDLPIQLPGGDGTIYKPQDYDGKWRGKNIRLRRALANSLNIPAIHVIQFTGIHDAISMAHSLGITTLNDESRYGVSLVLGGGEVHMLDMATAYGVFANQGVKVTPKSIIKVLDRNNHEITKTAIATTTANAASNQQVLDPRLAYMITDILSDNGARTEEFGANSPLKLPFPAAAKTGTTNDFRDNWTIGYTPNLVTAVWVGNNDHSAMNNVDGITGAAPIWHDYMIAALAGQPVKNFVQPPGMVRAKVCAADGGLSNPWDSSLIDELFLAESPQTKHCATQAPPPPPPPAPADDPTKKTPNDSTPPIPTDPNPFIKPPKNNDPNSH